MRQRFCGSFDGEAVLLFSGEKILNLVHAVIPEQLSSELSTEIEQDVLSEVGNIILNNCMGVFSEHLKVELDPGIPVVDRGPAGQLFEKTGEKAENTPEN